MKQIFYTPDIATNPILPHEESKHCLKVLRLTLGDEVRLTDGKGSFYHAKICDTNKKNCRVEILEVQKCAPHWGYNLHIAIAPTKNFERIEWFVEKAIEVGINEITPLKCMHSERKEVKSSRIEKIAISSMKQSLKATLPTLHPMTSFKEFIKQDFQGRKFIAHCEDGKKEFLKNLYKPQEDVLILIGPEGDFSTEEIQQARENGFEEISLGDSRLRTETAALSVCIATHLLNQ